LISKKYNRLTIIDIDKDKSTKNRKYYICLCNCGKFKSIRKDHIISGRSKSCGCLQKEKVSEVNKVIHSKINLTEDYGRYIKIFFFNTDNFTIIDKDDYKKIKDYCWTELAYKTSSYAVTCINNKLVRLHNLIMTYSNEYEIDHKNNNSLDNRKSNLRIATHAENNWNKGLRSNNTSGVTGVYWVKNLNKFRSEIKVKGKRIHLGYFDNIESAKKVREEAEIKYFGDFRFKGKTSLI
jgi:hypothetical protein